MKNYSLNNFLKDQKRICSRFATVNMNVFELYGSIEIKKELYPDKIITDYCHEMYANDEEIDPDYYANIILQIINYVNKNQRVLMKKNILINQKNKFKISTDFLKLLIENIANKNSISVDTIDLFSDIASMYYSYSLYLLKF